MLRDLVPAYLDDGLCLSGTYLETIISRSHQSQNIPYAWVQICHTVIKTQICYHAGLQGSLRSVFILHTKDTIEEIYLASQAEGVKSKAIACRRLLLPCVSNS